VDKELRAREPVSFDDLEERVSAEEVQIENTLELLVSKHPEVKQDGVIFSSIRTAIQQIKNIMSEAKKIADSYQEGRSELLHLAGLGLMVEIVAHELNRATTYTLGILQNSGAQNSQNLPSVFGTLEEQLKTLQKRLRILDPLSTRGRQVKSQFDLVSWVEENIKAHNAQFKRHGIAYEVTTVPKTLLPILQVRAVKGMIVQILENLISNSVYWLKQQKKISNDFRPRIAITILLNRKEIHFSDNGPGIAPDRKEDIFLPFFTTKPPGEGKGLGLYISREIADYHGASLFLSDEPSVQPDRLNTFILAMEPTTK
jgi:signal transduction histidine kinase